MSLYVLEIVEIIKITLVCLENVENKVICLELVENTFFRKSKK
jgi:hypothetical protein